MKVEYFFDCSSPWTYLSCNRLESICAKHQAQLIWKPFLVGGVFNTVNPSVYENRANPVQVKSAYYQKDMQDWARYQGITLGSPAVFPVNSVKAMRGAFVAIEEGVISSYAETVFRTYWSEGRDISQDEVMSDIVLEVGLNHDDFFNKITSQQYKDKLKDSTDELIARSGFGSPTMFVDKDDMYFGNDRLVLVDHRLSRG